MRFCERCDVGTAPKFALKCVALLVNTGHFYSEAEDDCPSPDAGQREANDDRLDHQIGIQKQFYW